MIRFSWGAASDVGRVRAQNQDCALVADRLVAVADGMGGHQGGEVASELAVQVLRRAAADPTAEAVVAAVRDANREIWQRGAEPELRGMGTTVCVLALVDGDPEPELVLANVGDSRIYQLEDGELVRRSVDHNLVEEMVRDGRLTPDEAARHPQRNVITRALGIAEDVAVDSWTTAATVGDRWLLCSDGLVNEVAEARIAATLRTYADPDEAAHELVRLANERGGRDNTTCVVIDVVDDDHDTAAPVTGDRVVRPRRDEVDDLAGFSTAPAPGVGPDDEVDTGPDEERSLLPPVEVVPETRPPRRVTWRTLGFLLLVVAVFAVAFAGVAWFARSAWFVAVDDEEVTIFQGRPDGVLWFDPTVAERTGLATDDLTPALLTRVDGTPEFATLDEARRFVANLAEQAAPPTTTTTTTTTSTTTTTTTTTTPTTAPATTAPPAP